MEHIRVLPSAAIPLAIEDIAETLSMRLKRNLVQDDTFPPHIANILRSDDGVDFIYDKLIQYKMMPKLTKVEKNSSDSIHMRTMGNNYYKDKRFQNALSCYSKAILFAPNGSKDVALAFGNRSAVLFSMKNYEASIRDIKRAFDYGYPDGLKEKLEVRLQSCQRLLMPLSDEELKLQNECDDKFHFTKRRNESIPCAISGVEVKYTAEMGRHVVAKESLAPGEVISIEKPYAAMLVRPCFLNHCYNCLTHTDDMIPCRSCCQVMFCDEKCRDENWSFFHKFECPMMEYLAKMVIQMNDLLALKTVLKGFHEYGDWVKLREAIHDREQCTDNLYKGFTKRINVDSPAVEYVLDSSSYLAIHALTTNIEKRSLEYIYSIVVPSAIFVHLLSKYTNIFNGVDNKLKKFVGNLLSHQCHVNRINALDIRKVPNAVSEYKMELPLIGSGIYAFMGMLNHSCATNVQRFTKGSSLILLTFRPIKAGSQLFDNYGFYYTKVPFVERQMSLKMDYEFVCSCEACTGNWPIYLFMKKSFLNKKQKKIVNQNKVLMSTVPSILKGDRKVALMVYEKARAVITELDEKAPCMTLMINQDMFSQCLRVFLSKFPLRDNQDEHFFIL